MAFILGVSFVSLLVLQFRYISEIHEVRKLHFDECVDRSLSDVARNLEDKSADISAEADSTEQSADLDSIEQKIEELDSIELSAELDSTVREDSIGATPYNNIQFYTRHSALQGVSPTSSETGSIEQGSYLPLEKRIDFAELDQLLKTKLVENGIKEEYHYKVLTAGGEVVYKCADYAEKGEDFSFKVTLFENDPVPQMGILEVHFPVLEDISRNSFVFILPSLVFTFAVLITFIVTLVLVFRQKKIAEIKNDFINNMTHEFKTPISSISLAAQMLDDDTISKSPQMTKRLSTTIMDETKRLRFQVDKVLQLSLYENQKVNYNLEDVDTNELISNIVKTFTLKVERSGGEISYETLAEKPLVYVDEMHITNVIFNLLDNAVKYKNPDHDLKLHLTTKNEHGHVVITIRDNGIGMKKEELKKIFEKFYRVHTGNVHDVKGFGLGLAYVKKIINDFHGTIAAESTLGEGTTFTIHLPEVSFK